MKHITPIRLTRDEMLDRGFLPEDLDRFDKNVVEAVAEDHAYHDGPVPSCPLCTTHEGRRHARLFLLQMEEYGVMAGE